MYIPDAFREDRVEVLQDSMRAIGAATVVGVSPNGLLATHVPIEIISDSSPWGRLRFHLARANPHVSAMREGGELLFIFQGPQGYVTPSWYPSKQEHGRVLPTWNYVMIHAYGSPEAFEGPKRLRPHLDALSGSFEAQFDAPWRIDDAPADFIDGMCNGIVGFEVVVDRLEGKWKLSQNRPSKDLEGVVLGLREVGDEASQKLADLVENAGNVENARNVENAD